jgi:hypothetical protein
LDDSAPKAILQPWNHLCVSEYGSERRKLDVKIAERERERKWLAERERERTWLAEQDGVKEVAEEEEMARDGTATDVDMAAVKSSENPTTEVENNEAERERKRKEKKLFKKEKLLLAKEQQLEVQGNGVEEEESYDELLLAVVGILDALKHEGNVAGWMRSGGLVHVVGGDQETISETPETEETLVTTTTTTTMSMPIPIPNPQTTVISSIFPLSPRSKRDSSSISIQGPSKRRRLSHSQDMGLDGERTLEMDSDSEMVVLPTTPTMITDKKSLSMSSVPSSESPLHPSPPHSSESPLLFSAQVEQALTGVPLSTAAEAAASSTTPTETSGNNMTSGSTPTPIPQTQFQHLLWHKRPCVLSYWVQRGRKALAELEIDIIHGVVPPNY